MIKFNFLKGYVYKGVIDLPMTTRRMAGRTIAQDLVPVQPMEGPRGDIFHLEQRNRLRWVDGRLNNLEFRVYTHLPFEEVQRIVERTISPFIYEPNIPINRWEMVRLLERRFHRAYIIT